MKNFISPINHPESFLSGSTIESMIDRAKKLKLPYFTITDHGSLISVLKGYAHGKKKDIKIIAGIELYFKDNDCEIIKNTESERIKYFKIAIHAKDQKTYQALVKMCSNNANRQEIWIRDEKQYLFTWKDLEEIAKYNVTVVTTDVEDMVSKHFLVGRPDLGKAYYKKLKDIFGAKNFYPSIIPYPYDKYWDTMVKLTLGGGKVVEIPANDRVEFEEENGKNKDGTQKWRPYQKAKASDLLRFKNKRKRLTSVFINKVKYQVKKENKTILSSELKKDFQDISGHDLQTEANKFIISLATEFNDLSKLLLNSYAYYANHDDKIVQDMKLGDEKRIYQHQYIMSSEDVLSYLKSDENLNLAESDIEKLIDNTYRWAENFKDFELKYDYRLVKPDSDPNKQLIDIIKKTGRMKWDDPVYVKQFREEFELLIQNGVINLIPYFLPIVDIYKYYEDNGYLTGPGRGSAGGFLISYLLGITHIDPIKYGLSSSRFLTTDRVQQGNLPDIDCDLESRIPLVGQDGNSGYLFKKYENKAAQVSTRTLLRIKSAILDANRFVNNGTVEEDVAKLSKSLPNTPQGVNDHEYVFGYEKDEEHIPGLIEKDEKLKAYAESRPEEWNIVKRALSISRQNSRHACAFILSDTAIEDTVPVMEVGGVKRITQPEAKQCEQAGLIKYDFLVVSSLKDINLCIKYINNKNNDKLKTGHFTHQGKDVYIWDLPEDPKVFEDLSAGHTESVFQLNSAGATPTVMKVQPKNIIDCATITSLERPGPKDFRDPNTGRNMVEEYIERKFGRSKSDIPIMAEMLPETYGVLVFQEQVTKLAKELANMNVIDSENVRIAVGKKKKKLIDSLKPIFIEGAAKKCGVETATKIWDMMETFARYGFNKSHAVAYSVISYACAFLKYHYPLEWWAAVLSNADDKKINEVFYKYIKDIVLPPDINTSTEQMSIDYEIGKIRNKLSTISGLGNKAAEKIIAQRPYLNLKDFVKKKVCGSSLTKRLIHVGVLDSLFEKNLSLEQKIFKYELTLKEVSFEEKLQKHDEKIKTFKANNDELNANKAQKARDKFYAKGFDKDIEIDDLYSTLTPKQDYLIKKSIFPTMNMDLLAVLQRDSKFPVMQGNGFKFLELGVMGSVRILSGEYLQKIDDSILNHEVSFATPGYVMSMSEFTYHGNKKALKMIIDSSGYVSEKVVWPDYNTGQLNYPKTLQKGSLAWFVYNKRPGKPYTNISDIYIEASGIVD